MKKKEIHEESSSSHSSVHSVNKKKVITKQRANRLTRVKVTIWMKETVRNDQIVSVYGKNELVENVISISIGRCGCCFKLA